MGKTGADTLANAVQRHQNQKLEMVEQAIEEGGKRGRDAGDEGAEDDDEGDEGDSNRTEARKPTSSMTKAHNKDQDEQKHTQVPNVQNQTRDRKDAEADNESSIVSGV